MKKIQDAQMKFTLLFNIEDINTTKSRATKKSFFFHLWNKRGLRNDEYSKSKRVEIQVKRIHSHTDHVKRKRG